MQGYFNTIEDPPHTHQAFVWCGGKANFPKNAILRFSMRKDVQKPAFDAPLYPMRINKYLAFKKHSTRRGADELIKEGKVFLNGKLAVLGDKVQEGDNVEVRFRGKVRPHIYLAYNKHKGIVTHSA